MINIKSNKISIFFVIIAFFLSNCNGKLPGGDARKTPANPAKRIEQNLAEGRGFKLNDAFKKKEVGFLILQVLIIFGKLH
jgi:hypothetical protein